MKSLKMLVLAAVAAAGVMRGSAAVCAVGPAEDALEICAEDVYLDVLETVDRSFRNYFTIDSGSDWTVSVSGLPTGVSFNSKTLEFSGAPRKAGRYYVTFKAKNCNKFQHSVTVLWEVGSPADTDYDGIGMSNDWLEDFDNLATGKYVGFCLNANLKSVSGLPSGLKFQRGSFCDSSGMCTACSDIISGTPTKAGKYTIKLTDVWGHTTVKTIIVRDSGCVYVKVDAPYASECGIGQSGTWCKATGTVSGGGVYAIGSKVSLRASPKAGYVFAGWYSDEYMEDPMTELASGDWRKASDTLVLSSDRCHLGMPCVRICGMFVSKYEDYGPYIDCEDVWHVDASSWRDVLPVYVDSVSMPSVSVRGLPSGIKFQDGMFYVADVNKLSPGTKDVVITAKNASGRFDTKTVSIVVPNLQSDFFTDIDYEGEYVFTVGESDTCKVPPSIGFEPGMTVSVSGLPSGLRASVDKVGGRVYIYGMPTKAGVYTVTLTAKEGSHTEKATVTFRVMPFPVRAIGTYSGVLLGCSDCGDLWEEEEGCGLGLHHAIADVQGSLSVTVSANGKMSAKLSGCGQTVSFSGNACSVTDEGIDVYLYDAKGNWLELYIQQSDDFGQYQVTGDAYLEKSGYLWGLAAQKNEFKSDSTLKEMVRTLARFGKMPAVVGGGNFACPNCVLSQGKPETVMFSVSQDGTVKASGSIEGVSVSGSSTLKVEVVDFDKTILYADFASYKSSTASLLSYRVIFDWDWILDCVEYGYGARSAVYDGGYWFSCP